MKIVVISLPTSQDRRAKVTQLLGDKSIEFEFLDAVDGRTGNHPYLNDYKEKTYLLNRCRKAAPGELGCYVSHILAWEKCVALNEPIVILEDDFELTEDFVAGLKFVEQYTDRVTFIRLENMVKTHYVASPYKDEKFSLVKQLKVEMCATGYVITPKGATALLANGKEMCAPVDLYLRHTLLHKQLMYALIPHIVYPLHADTTIGWEIRKRKEKSLVLKIKRFFHKWFFAIGNVAVNLINSYKSS